MTGFQYFLNTFIYPTIICVIAILGLGLLKNLGIPETILGIGVILVLLFNFFGLILPSTKDRIEAVGFNKHTVWLIIVPVVNSFFMLLLCFVRKKN